MRQAVMPRRICAGSRRAAKLEALGLAPRARSQHWRRRLYGLDALIGCLGLPAAHALLVLAPPGCVAAMAAEAVSRARQPPHAMAFDGECNGVGDSARTAAAFAGGQLSGDEAADVVRWYRGLAGRRLTAGLAQALAQRGLLPPGGRREPD